MSLNKCIESLENSRNCTNCKGVKTLFRSGFTALDGTIYPDTNKECYSCKGLGVFNKPDLDVIYKALQGRKSIRTAKPKNNHRAAYVWRMYRFHGGIDVTLPMMAMFDVSGDPYEKVLDDFASALAVKFRGSDKIAAYRWGKALGFVSEIPAGLCDTAYELGPEKDNK